MFNLFGACLSHVCKWIRLASGDLTYDSNRTPASPFFFSGLNVVDFCWHARSFRFCFDAGGPASRFALVGQISGGWGGTVTLFFLLVIMSWL